MKICRNCLVEKDDLDFPIKRNKRDSRCYVCRREYDRKFYKLRVDPKRKRELDQIRHEKIVFQLINFLKKHPCIDCGEADPIVLDFDHQKNNKKITIAALLSRGASFLTILKEAAKCVVRCANCHRRKTAIEGNWNKLKFIDKNE